MDDPLVTAREAVVRHAWSEAREAFTSVDRDSSLSPGDLQLLADASWWSGDPEEAVEALERAYTGFIEVGENIAAAIVAMQLAYFAMRRLAGAVAAGWMSKAQHLLENEPETVGHAWFELIRTAEALFMRRNYDDVITIGDRALELSRKHNAPAVQALVSGWKGYALLAKGEWQEGTALIDEATAAAVSGELDPRSACDVYCNTIACCRTIGDYRRAGEWTEEADRWMQRQSLGGYPGVCRVHRAELKRLKGSYPEAEQEARVACEELERFHLMDGVGFAHYEIGEVRLRMGDLEGAEQAFMRAYEFGSDAQPGFALLGLARGDIDGAAKAIESRLAGGERGESTIDRLDRAHLLPAQVTIALAAGDIDTARNATEELERVAVDYERPAFEAAALTARGAVELHDGRAKEASAALGKAWRLWREIEFPYESAQARMLLGRAMAAAGDDATAWMDLSAARSVFERLGAARELRAIDELLGGQVAVSTANGDRVTRTFMFTDIVTSTDLVGLVGDAAWEDLLRWHDRALRSEIAKHRGQEVRHTGDGFFVAFEQASDAVEAAVAIQRRLAEHRREHGFAPWVRIGLHTAEASPQGLDYAGHGVHVAARVGDVGEREEIVISAETLSSVDGIRFPTSDPRSLSFKGVTDPVEVRTIDWR